MLQNLMTTTPSVSSDRILYTPSPFARSSLFYLQEVGTLRAIRPHTSTRSNLTSYLCFVVLRGSGCLKYGEETYELGEGDVVFIDCRSSYSHSTPAVQDGMDLWNLQWVHFYGPSLTSIYLKYMERGGRPVFHPKDITSITSILTKLYQLASSSDYIRDMRINRALSELLTLLMESWHPDTTKKTAKQAKVIEVKMYLEEHYMEKISLDVLAEQFFINKYYLSKLFKESYGMTINAYILSVRITRAKQLLRFSDRTIDEIGEKVGIADGNYFARVFKKIEGVTPSEYRKMW